MKKLYSLILFVIANVSITLAQPTLTGATSNPVAGDNFLIHTFTPTSFQPGIGAGNSTWLFGSAISTGTGTYSYSAASSTPNASFFPGANLANNAGAAYEYINVNSSVYARVGFYANGTPVNYTNSETILTYPFTYGSS